MGGEEMTWEFKCRRCGETIDLDVDEGRLFITERGLRFVFCGDCIHEVCTDEFRRLEGWR